MGFPREMHLVASQEGGFTKTRRGEHAVRKGGERGGKKENRHMNKSFSFPFQKQGTRESHAGRKPVFLGEASDLVFGLYCFTSK